MSSSTLVHTCLRTQVCSCGYDEIQRFSAPSSGDGGRKRTRRTNSSLPDDILSEILLRLPANALFQFKHACKLWYNLIRSPNFISTHYAFHKKDKLSLCCYSFARGASTITFLFSDISLDLAGPGRISFDRPKIVGCSYGLVCLSLFDRDTRYLLWNPATGQFRVLSASGECCLASTAWVFSGFYFDGLANTHKLVRISFFRSYREKKLSGYLDVFTVSNSTWEKKMKKLDIPSGIPDSSTEMTEKLVTCVGKYMYWVMDSCLLCFHMVDHFFQIIEFPCVDLHHHPETFLAQYKESLAMFVWKVDDQSFDMWLLNDYNGSRHTWSKKLTLRPSLPNVGFALGFYVKGDVELLVLATGGGYFLWDTDSGEATRVFWEGGYISHGQFFLYRQSLASVG